MFCCCKSSAHFLSRSVSLVWLKFDLFTLIIIFFLFLSLVLLIRFLSVLWLQPRRHLISRCNCGIILEAQFPDGSQFLKHRLTQWISSREQFLLDICSIWRLTHGSRYRCQGIVAVRLRPFTEWTVQAADRMSLSREISRSIVSITP